MNGCLFVDNRYIPRGSIDIAAGAVGVFDLTAALQSSKRLSVEVTGGSVNVVSWPTPVTADLTTITAAVNRELTRPTEKVWQLTLADLSKLDGIYNPIELHAAGTVTFRGIAQSWGTNLGPKIPRNALPAGEPGDIIVASIYANTPVATNAVRWMRPTALIGRTIAENTGIIMVLDTHYTALAFYNSGASTATVKITELGS